MSGMYSECDQLWVTDKAVFVNLLIINQIVYIFVTTEMCPSFVALLMIH